MADTIIITQASGGVIKVDNGAKEYNLLPSYRLQKLDAVVQVITDLGGLIDEFEPVEVEKVVFADGSEVLIGDLQTLFDQLLLVFALSSGNIGVTFGPFVTVAVDDTVDIVIPKNPQRKGAILTNDINGEDCRIGFGADDPVFATDGLLLEKGDELIIDSSLLATEDIKAICDVGKNTSIAYQEAV